MPAKLSDLLEALEFASVDGDECEAYVDRRTGRTWLCIDPSISGVEENLPDDLGSDHYLMVPDRRALGLGKPLALAFACQHLAADFDDVADMFSRRGAYRRFDHLLESRGMRQRWHAFMAEAEKTALLAWCADEGLEVEGA